MSCGCCITQRWEQVRKTWQWHLLLQLGPLSQLSDIGRESTRWVSASFVLKAYRRFLGFLHVSSRLFTEQRRLCFALPVWRSASWLIIQSTEQFQFTAVINNNLTACVAWVRLMVLPAIQVSVRLLPLPVCTGLSSSFRLVLTNSDAVSPSMHSTNWLLRQQHKDSIYVCFFVILPVFAPCDSFLMSSRRGW